MQWWLYFCSLPMCTNRVGTILKFSKWYSANEAWAELRPQFWLVHLLFEELAECSVEEQSCTINRDGVARLVRRFYDGVEPTPERLQQVYSNFDLDGDGAITWEEFRTGVQSLFEEFDPRASTELDHS